MEFHMLHPADQLVMIMNRIYNYGMTTISGGNLSIMDSDGVMWITPAGVDKGSLKREDIMQVYPDGSIKGNHRPSSEYPFHSSVYRARPDIKAILHAHPPSLVALSLVRVLPNMRLIPNAAMVCGEVAMAEYALPGSAELGEKIAKEFGKGYNTVMLENHGVVLGAESLFKAFTMFETLDFSARLEIRARRLGEIHTLTDHHLDIYRQKSKVSLEEFTPGPRSSKELALRRDMCTYLQRGYHNQLFTSGQGTYSAKLDPNSFIITPYDKDRAYLQPEDLVLIRDGRREAGKIPSRSVALHQDIYEKHPELEAVVIAHPPNIMAFAVTGETFDARLIPESYIMLKTVKKLPFGSSVLQPAMVADELSIKNPVLIIENDCVIIGGTDLLNALDRLEVMEYSAKSVIYSRDIGRIVTISPEEVKEIEVAFKL